MYIVLEPNLPYVPSRKDIIDARLHQIDQLRTKPRTLLGILRGNAADIAYVASFDAEVLALQTERKTLP